MASSASYKNAYNILFWGLFYILNFQIVRADLQELHDLDLNGAPYGYTPFCSDRKEMDGFRFVLNGSV